MNGRIGSMLITVLIGLALSGCPLQIGEAEVRVTIVNQTTRSVQVVQVDVGGSPPPIPPGHRRQILPGGCSSDTLEATWPDGTVVATVQDYCDNPTWIIRGVEDATLRD